MILRKLFKPEHLSSLIMLGLVGASILACGGNNVGGSECSLDSECSAGSVCDTSTGTGYCVEPCQTDQECGTGYKCLARANSADGTKTCQTSGGTSNNTGGACTTNEECTSRLGRDAVCNNGTCEPIGGGPACTTNEECTATLGPDALCVAGTCEAPQTQYQIILVEDTSSGASACTSTNASGLKDPGSDIIWIELLDAQGATLGYGAALDVTMGDNENNDYQDFGVLDGKAPNANGFCPDGGFGNDTVYSMNCGGTMFVEFQDSAGQPVNIQPGHTVRVVEYADQCAGGGRSDSFSVYLCTDTASARNSSNTSCTNPIISNGTGEVTGIVRN